jgi:hypothetical protein
MEDFAPFELAVKLKEKGFPQRPDYFNYSSYYDWDGLRKIHSLSNASVWFDPNISRDNIYFAPTISQVLKWLFDKKQLFVNIDCNIYNKFGLFFTIYKKGEETWETCGFDDNYYNKPEEAALAGIEYVLDNLI